MPFWLGCVEPALVELRIRAADGDSVAAVRLRLLEGSVPFEISAGPIELEKDGVATTTWEDPLSPAKLPFGARLVVAAVSESGVEGEWFEVEVWDPGSWAFLAWLGSWFWPATCFIGIGAFIWLMGRRQRLSEQAGRRER